ncbi:LacI family DNA-binding transcriptional regulator [Clostridium ganghwense]|uniref:LacI family DNA-binding transcriptional regulator n=1 Tax=Clostridium ganghwense TaxID=312089 RepID=A0ABT4CQ08_9CLOT|nr:LacI family DNA-binding transcriptional regulator [Clostridium ganghwense]MCY6371136.1 LacI family DNA-binding transcriptional regulator [Clostridium ganghwense]
MTTIKEIAEIAGVSHSTVSRSLNNSSLISEKTKIKIKKIATELNFEFNSSAQSLNTNKTGTIGIIYPEQTAEIRMSVYLTSLLNDIRGILEKELIDSIVSFPKNRFTMKSNIKRLISKKKVDGLMIVHSDINSEDWDYIRESRIPCIFLHYMPKLHMKAEVDFVSTDHFVGGILATSHLIQLGHKRIMCLTGNKTEEEVKQRISGYTSVFKQNCLPVDTKLIFEGDFSFESGYNIVKQNIDIVKTVTAIFAQSDLMALGAIKALREIGVKIPQDIAIIGYDDLDIGSYFLPLLTTIRQPREQIAKIGCERLLQLLNGKQIHSHQSKFVQPRLIIRETC